MTRAQPKKVATFPVLVAPFNEQKRIADKLNALLARVDSCQEHLERIPQILKRFRQAVLAAATSDQLPGEWENKQGEWETCLLGDVIIDIRYGTAKKSTYESKNGIPVLRIPNIGDRKIDPTDLKFSHFDEKEIETLSLKTDDLLLVRSNGSIELVGKVALVGSEFEGYLYAGYLIRLRFDKTRVSPRYISLYLSSPAIRSFIELTARSTSGVNNINAEEVKAIPLKLPPLDEQQEIVRRVETLFALSDRFESRWRFIQAQVAQLTPAILAKAFRGELVEQDPNDESAEKLLERIRVARANAPKGIKSPRRKSGMKSTKTEDKQIGVIEALQKVGNELSTEQLFQSAGYPLDAEPDLVEEFFVDLRDTLKNGRVNKRRFNNSDWFSLNQK